MGIRKDRKSAGKEVSEEEERRVCGHISDFFLPAPGQVLGWSIKNNQIRLRNVGADGLSHFPGHRLGFQVPLKKENNQQGASQVTGWNG